MLTLSNGTSVARIAAGETYVSVPIAIPVPSTAPDNLSLRLEVAHVYHNHGKPEQVTMSGLRTSQAVELVDTSYYGEVLNVLPESSTGDRDIVITGRAVERGTGELMPKVPLNLVITLNGFERTHEIYTDEDGYFDYTFVPFEQEAGSYQVRAVHPDITDRPVQATLTISRVAIAPTEIDLSMPLNYEKTISIKIKPAEGTNLTNARIDWNAADQTAGVYPQGVNFEPGDPIPTVAGGETATLEFALWADNEAEHLQRFVFKVKGDELPDGFWGCIGVDASFSEANPSLAFTPSYIETGMAREETVTEVVTLKNKGLETANGVKAALVATDGGSVPNWVVLNTNNEIGDIQVGEEREISVTFSPSESVAEGIHSFYLRISADNHSTVDAGVYAAVTQSGIGDVLFKLSDIYTGTIDQQTQEPIQGLGGATVKIQNEEVTTISHQLKTDDYGEALFTGLPVGRYKYRISAPNHKYYSGRLWIKPGITQVESIFMRYELVTITWSVKEIPLEDRYDVVMTPTYETNVPAPVVVAEPASVHLPQMEAGDVYNGEFILTNYGLVRAENVEFSLPENDEHMQYELPSGLPTTIEPKQSVTIPYRVTCIKTTSQSQETGTGGEGTEEGGCTYHSMTVTIRVEYWGECSNGSLASWTQKFNYFYDWLIGDCEGLTKEDFIGSFGRGGEQTINEGDNYSWNEETQEYTVTHGSQLINGSRCVPKPFRIKTKGDPWAVYNGEQSKFDLFEIVVGKDSTAFTGHWVTKHEPISMCTFSSVDTLMGEYNRSHTDIKVKVPGDVIKLTRRYYAHAWHLGLFDMLLTDPDLPPLSLTQTGDTIDSIELDSQAYDAVNPGLWIFGTELQITRTSTGFRWENKFGGWRDYNELGYLTAFGDTFDTVAKILYDSDHTGRLIGVANRDDIQVIWIDYNADGLIASIHDIDDRQVGYEYSAGLLTRVVDLNGNETHYEYDEQGRLNRTVGADGRESLVEYDELGLVTGNTDRYGNTYHFDYGYDEMKDEFYTMAETPTGLVKEIWYDSDGDVRRVDINGKNSKMVAKDGRNLIITDDKGQLTRQEFDEWDNLTKITYPDGSEESYTYDLRFNKPDSHTDENGVVTETVYDDQGRVIRTVKAAGSHEEQVVEFEYDQRGNLITLTHYGDAQSDPAITRTEYDDDGNIITKTDPEENVTRYTYDVMGNRLTMLDPRGNLWSYDYDDAGHLISVTDPLDAVTRMHYDEVGNMYLKVDAEGNETLYEYDEHDNVVKTTNAEGDVSYFIYDGEDKLIRKTDGEGNQIMYEYDQFGRLRKTIDGNLNETLQEFDDTVDSACYACAGGGGTHQPIQITYPTYTKEFKYDKRQRKVFEKEKLSADEAYFTWFEYDEAGNVISRTDREGQVTRYQYDGLNRLVKMIDAMNGETTYAYDGRNNLISLTDPDRQTTTFEYDLNNRLVKEIRPMGQTLTYGYDAAGHLIDKIDPKNQKTEYGYDEAGRMVETRFYSADDHATPIKTVIYGYDKIGNMISYDDGVTSAQYEFDGANRKIAETVDYGSFQLTSGFTYYKNGLRASYTGPDGVTYGYSYDANNQLTALEIPGKGTITWNEYLWTRPLTLALPGGSAKQFAYDPMMRTTGIDVTDPGQNTFLNYVYTHDKIGNVATKDTEHGDYSFDYDDLYRLTDVDNPVQPDEAFTYDGVGNRLTSIDSSTEWTYNENNELTGHDDVTYDYDLNGNMIEKNAGGVVTRFFYNVEDRLERVEDGSSNVIASYYYDPFGRRLWKDVGGTRTFFHYSDEGLVGEYDAAGDVIKTYGWKPGSSWATDPLFMKIGTEYYFYHNDHIGTPQKMTSVSGAVVWSAKYSSFGEASIDVETVANNLRFPGQFYDAETGLHYNFHRNYNPVTGRYLMPDPFGLAGGLNLYRYSLNNPVNLIDQYGLQPHANFIKQVAKYTNRGLPSALKKIRKNIAEHEKALNDPCQELAKNHHEHELRVFKEKLKIVEKEAAKRGLLGAGAAGTFEENISEGEAEDRTSSWFDWIDPNLGPGMAY